MQNDIVWGIHHKTTPLSYLPRKWFTRRRIFWLLVDNSIVRKSRNETWWPWWFLLIDFLFSFIVCSRLFWFIFDFSKQQSRITEMEWKIITEMPYKAIKISPYTVIFIFRSANEKGIRVSRVWVRIILHVAKNANFCQKQKYRQSWIMKIFSFWLNFLLCKRLA